MFVRTGRLLLRPLWAEDATALAALTADPMLDVEEAGAIAREGLAIFARTGGAPRLIGAVRLRHDRTAGDVALWIGSAYWGLGFATEALAAVRDLALGSLQLDRIEVRLQPRHAGLARALLRTGFVPARDLGGWRGYRLERSGGEAMRLAA